MLDVLLLRAPSHDSANSYETSFQSVGYHAISIPVLETVLTSVDELDLIVGSKDASKRFAGVVITSARACEAWRNAIDRLTKSSASVPLLEDTWNDSSPWSSTPFYVVGKATSSTLSSISDSYAGNPLCPKDIRGGGDESGTSERLARFILDDLPSSGHSTARVLYLTGDKNRDTLPSILRKGGIALDTLQVYGTQGSSSFEDDLHHVVNARDLREPPWIVFFAPSSAEFVLPMLRKHFAIGTTNLSSKEARIASIGPTTTTYLEEHLHVHVHLTASKPSAQDLARGIAGWTVEQVD